MTKMDVAKKHLEALLDSLDTANCPNGCKCVFCRAFDAGYKAGMEDAATTLQQQVEKFTRRAEQK